MDLENKEPPAAAQLTWRERLDKARQSDGQWLSALALASVVGFSWTLGGFLVSAGSAILAWGHTKWTPAFGNLSSTFDGQRVWNRQPILPLLGILASAILVVGANLAYVGDPTASFGWAGWLWVEAIGLLLVATFLWSRRRRVEENASEAAPWPLWEIATLAGITLLAFTLRVWDLRSFPNNVYPDEIMTGQVAAQAYLSGQPAPSIFSTLWGGIDLPALWFFIVSRFQMWGDSTLEMLRLPPALFGAATVLPFYGMVRGVWGRWAAIGGTTILAASASNINYSRLALNNIVAPFFWTLCFFFLLRGLRQRKPLDWALAGLSAGLSEHFYNGTRLLPFILVAFFVFLLIFHRRQVKSFLGSFALAVLGYFVGFGPLLAHFLTNPNLYFGRGAELMVVKQLVPRSLEEAGQMWNTLMPIVGDNLQGLSTLPSQDIMYFAPLLLKPEAGLLVLGFALLVWKWRHPAAFLMLLSGLGVLFVGGTLISYPNAAFPQLNHWTPAFPAIYAAIAVPIGAAATIVEQQVSGRRWLVPVALSAGLAALVVANVIFYFTEHKADTTLLRSESYRRAQEYYNVQTAQSRYIASLGRDYRIVWVGQSAQPYDPQLTYALMRGNEDGVRLSDVPNELPNLKGNGKKLAFIIFQENNHYLPLVKERFPDGTVGLVYPPNNKYPPLFTTYEVGPVP